MHSIRIGSMCIQCGRNQYALNTHRMCIRCPVSTGLNAQAFVQRGDPGISSHSGCIVCFASFYLVEFCSGSLHVESETVFIYKLMFSVHVVIKIQGGKHISVFNAYWLHPH